MKSSGVELWNGLFNGSFLFFGARMDGYFGRTVIYSDAEEITRENVLEVIQTAVSAHSENQSQIDFLYGYYKGDQNIYDREKEIRPDIDYKVVENRCKEVVDFKCGYSIGAPIQYNDRTGEHTDAINQLNTIMDYENRNSVDEAVVEWNLICGTAYKIALTKDEPDDISNIEFYSLDPRQTFVIYSSGMKHEPLAGVWYSTDSESNTYYHVYTPSRYFKLLDTDEIEEESVNGIGKIPIIEFPANNARLGAFEPVLDLQDMINNIDSDRADAISQFVQSLIVATNCDFEEGTTSQSIMQSGIVSLTSVDGMAQTIEVLTQELNQSQTQTLKDDIYDAILTICAMPNRNGSSLGDTGIAVVYRDGWSAAETAALKYETVYKRAEKQFIDVCLTILGTGRNSLDLRASDVEVKFTRTNYEGIAQKVEVLNTMLNNGKIAPRLAFIYSKIFPDPEAAYKESLPYIESSIQAEELEQIDNREV